MHTERGAAEEFSLPGLGWASQVDGVRGEEEEDSMPCQKHEIGCGVKGQLFGSENVLQCVELLARPSTPVCTASTASEF